MNRSRLSRGALVALLLAASAARPASSADAQQATSMADAPARSLTLAAALAAARRVSPDLVAAREAVAAAAARERQAAAFPNPTLSYGREQTSGGGQTNAQNVAALEQPLEAGGVRGARRDAARLRREAAEARLAAAESQLDYEVARAYALALAADRRAALAEQAAGAFDQARRVSERRLAAGDVSGYANRRIRLEAARYAALRVEAVLARRTAQLALAALVAESADSIAGAIVTLADTLPATPAVADQPTLIALALRSRAELRAGERESQAAAAEARLARRERMPVPVVSGGFKSEDAAGGQGLSGFVAGVSLPLPLWDRRGGTVDAAAAESRRGAAETESLRRRVAREVAEAYDAYRLGAEQLAALAPQLGSESRAALRASQVAYSEGEISLVECLDAVRAYHEAESSFASIRADLLVRRAALERAVGAPLSPTTSTRGTAAPQE